jgi:DNA polymerase III alpha subunit
MHNDIYGRQILEEIDICVAYLKNPNLQILNGLVNSVIDFSDDLELTNTPTFEVYTPLDISVTEFDDNSRNNWYMPEEYKTLDIAKWVLDLCKTEEELQRVGLELIMFQERDMFSLLRYCKYLVDTMRKHNVVWGVGRGSSVSSYVLYLLGIHRINSIHYDLSIDEFLK